MYVLVDVYNRDCFLTAFDDYDAAYDEMFSRYCETCENFDIPLNDKYFYDEYDAWANIRIYSADITCDREHCDGYIEEI